MINVVGGALTRIYLLNKMSVPSPPVLSTTALEKLLATGVLAAMSLAGLMVLHPRLVPHLPSYAASAGVAIFLLLLGGAAFGEVVAEEIGAIADFDHIIELLE